MNINQPLTSKIGTSVTNLKAIDILVANKPDCFIIYSGTNDITNGINSLNSVNKICEKKVEQTSSYTRTVFSSLTPRENKIDLNKKVHGFNHILKNYRAQTNIVYIDNNNIKEKHIGSNLNNGGNKVCANNLFNHLQSPF